MQQQLLLVNLSICTTLVGVVVSYVSDFVTLRVQNNWSLEDISTASENNYKVLSGSREWTRYADISDYYGLRYRPLHQMPRLLWHKQPQVDIPTDSVPTSTADADTSEADAADEYDEQDSEEEFLEQPIAALPTDRPSPSSTVRSAQIVTTPTPATVVMTLPTVNSAAASDTINSIMRPPQIGNAIKQLLFHGSPFALNLLQQQNRGNKTRSKGFLSLFEVIKFENTKCSVAMGEIDVRVRAMEGICYHEFECKSLGGIPTEACADGMGVCCVFLTGCGGTTKQSVVYFESPNYPDPVREMLICVLIINLRDNVQQLRLDFIMFELNRPTDGDCMDDQFIVSGQNINFVVPILCGINTGQHIYVDVTNSFEKKIYLSFITKVAAGDRSFNIKIVQLENDLAPEGCLQFYPETEGVVKSFNYDSAGTFVNTVGATYLNNLNYAICLLRAKDMCSVNYNTEQIGGDQLDFQIVNKDEDAVDLVPDGQAGAGIFNCPDDYIAINQVRLCGERFNDGIVSDDFTQNAPVKDFAAGPIILPVRSDDEYVGRGFRLVYKQELCA
ncbi:PREDICTED: uncharacterized protein LOC108377170 [Rhagoletis zephyria]|uniref:uncharacterized protein LOC108377170 n=1 Tax=Rhagoletis zephyria TaxID=28612 RepID=UPI0008114BAA|nr:PREDICTED: uncharacterized protein LOC108377170 [Rhagoletis zephyria]